MKTLRTHAKPTIFFSNPKVSPQALLNPHYEKTVQRAKAVNPAHAILAIQDSTFFNYTEHLAKTELGRIGQSGRRRNQYGLIQHTTLCVTDQKEMLGLIDVQHFHHDEFKTDIPSNHRQPSEKQSNCWLKGAKARRQRLNQIQQTVITVSDRESDIFEFLYDLSQHREAFVVRSKFSRYTGMKHRSHQSPLHARLKRQNCLGHLVFSIWNENKKIYEPVRFHIKRESQVYLPPPYIGKGRNIKDFQAIPVNALLAYSQSYEWILLTSLPVDSLQACQKVIEIYRMRWFIEDYFKVLKTGFQVERIYLHASRQAIENLLSMSAICACRLYWLIYSGRGNFDLKADALFAGYEWHAVYHYLGENIPEKTPALATVMLKIAQLGGYKPSKKGCLPGIKTFWFAFSRFYEIIKIHRSVELSIKT